MLFKRDTKQTFKYVGTRTAMDGNTAVIMCEREASDAAGAYPITPSTQMGEFWAEEVSKGHINISGRPLIFIEPESEHAAAAVTAGLSMTGLRAINFSSAQGVAFMHESLYAAAGKRLPYILNIGCRAITKAGLNVHASHDDYHSVDDTGFFQVLGKNAQEACDLNIIGHKIAELSLTPGIVAQDGFLTTHLIESINLPERALIEEYLGRPDDMIDSPTPAQRLLYGPKRRRIPAIWDVDNPVTSGSSQNQDAYMQQVAAQRPYFYDHVVEITEQCMDEYHQLTGRRYGRINTYRADDADYLIVGMGSMITTAEAVADYLRETRKLKVGVVAITMFRPFPGDLLGAVLKGKKGVAVMERTDQPLAEDLPLMRETRAAISKCIENGQYEKQDKPYPKYARYAKTTDIPRLYSGVYGLGSRDLQPEGIIGAIENMLPDGGQRRNFYLGVDFVRDQLATPKQELYMQELLEAYPRIGELQVKGSENPDLMPKNTIAVRFHSVGGWGAMTTGKNLAMTLFELLDYDIKANPKYGSEKKGQPTTYYLAAAPEPIRVNADLKFVDVVLSPDPNVFDHSNPLSGLKQGGVFVIQSSLESAEAVWRSFPLSARRYIVDKQIRVFYLDAFRIARDEASNPELQFRMQGIAFQGAFFAASPVMKQKELDEPALFRAIEDQLQSKFGGKGARVVEDNLRVVRRGFSELTEITDKPLDSHAIIQAPVKKDADLPVMLKRLPSSLMPASDVHRFWEQTGSFYVSGQGNDNLVDPFIGLSLIPASTGVFRDMTQIRFDYPEWLPEKCTACGDCYTVCPDSAIPGLVNTVSEVFDSAIRRIETGGRPTRFLRRAVRDAEKRLRSYVEAAGDGCDMPALIESALDRTLQESALTEQENLKLAEEMGWLKDTLGGFKFAITKPYYSALEKRAKGSGGLFSITVNPYTCKGCMACVTVCNDEALVAARQTPEAVERLRRDWQFWLDLPTTKPDYIRIDDLDERIGALETLLLDKRAYGSMNCGDGACLGCGEKTVIHLFTAAVTALMQPRIKRHLAQVDELIAGLEKHIRLRLAETMDLSDVSAVTKVVAEHTAKNLTLARLSEGLEEGKAGQPVDPEWLKWATGLLSKLRDLKWRYSEGVTGQGRSDMGIVNATGCTSVWGSTFPYNPYPFPWTSHLFQDSPSMAMGLFEGHMAKMAEGFKAVRMAELELKGEYNPATHDDFFTRFNWKQFSDEEFLLCPPVVSVGGDGAMYDIGFQNLSRALMSGMPIKVLVLDTQVYSNTGGQACTSGFISQVSDMAPYGKAWKGKEEIRKEMSLIAMAHRTTYVMQGAISNVTHLLESYIEGLNSRRPALFNVYAVCQPEHGVGDDASFDQSKLAVESRAYPLFRYNPDLGETFRECCDIEGNPSIDADWPTYTLNYVDDAGKEQSMQLPMTFADFALTEGRFRKHFKKAPPETWNADMLPLHEFLELSEDEREGRFPFLWTVDRKNRLGRVLVAAELVRSAEERRAFWRQLKGIVGLDQVVNVEAVAEQARLEMAQKLTSSLLALATGGAGNLTQALTAPGAVIPAGGNGGAVAAGAADYDPVWVETPECTACDECIEIAPNVFAYNADKKVEIVNPRGAPFKDIVKAAEKCTAMCIHPGTPYNPSESGLDKLVARAAKFN
ncbi:MAG: 2-oxoacid:acceptor oxidoreductase family protein [Chromatiales bacterium]|jgi:pyruvate-ferredoxin/flavodoxin oxidoreductase|nr:2-oxoacid:acceptor oxidoreductase family protein [Chromatiales bacterium]MDX9766074.1 2-oxoacid:acceptor oxidoreductase family protein [Ectothiorhodospiraceae bacterium]